LRGSRYFVTVQDHIGADWVRKTGIRDFWCHVRGQLDALSVCSECSSNRVMYFLVDRRRRFAKRRLGRRNHDRVGQIIAVENNSAAGPAANEVALARMIRNISKLSKLSDRKRRMIPFVKPNRWRGRVFQQRFINRHIERRGSRRFVVINVE